MRSICGIKRVINNSALGGVLCLAGLLLLSLGSGGCRATQTTTLKLGLIAPFEGAQRDLGYAVLPAVRLAVQEQNAAGGVGGYPVELVALNDENDPRQATVAALKLCVDPAVIGVIGHWTEEAVLAALPAYRDAGLPLVVPIAGDYDSFPSWVVQLAPSRQQVARAIAGLVLQRSRTVLLFVYPEQETGWRAALAGAGVIPTSENADICLLALDYEDTNRQLARFDSPLQVLLNDLYLPLLPAVRNLPKDSVMAWTLLPAPGAKSNDFESAYRVQTGRSPSLQARLAYDAATLLMSSANGAGARGGRIDRVRVGNEMRRQQMAGVSGMLGFDDSGRRREVSIEFQSAHRLLGIPANGK